MAEVGAGDRETRRAWWFGKMAEPLKSWPFVAAASRDGSRSDLRKPQGQMADGKPNKFRVRSSERRLGALFFGVGSRKPHDLRAEKQK